MSFLDLPAPDWSTLPGGNSNAEQWLAARARKLAFAAEAVQRIDATATALERQGALFACKPDALKAVPHAAAFYLDLLGLTRKTLAITKDRVARFGMTVSPLTIATNLTMGRAVTSGNLAAFCNWINDEMDAVFPDHSRTAKLAVGTVLTIEGARINGRVQNMAGNDAVLLLKTLLVGAMEARGLSVEVPDRKGQWMTYAPAFDLADSAQLRFGGRLVCELVPGGNRPDIKFIRNGVTLAVGEVKGRKDLGNLWESWMPQIAGHLRTWTSEHPDAPRLFFGTIITEEMIEGKTAGGTHHSGLKVLQKNGLLTTAYNLSLIAAGNPQANGSFGSFCDHLVHAL